MKKDIIDPEPISETVLLKSRITELECTVAKLKEEIFNMKSNSYCSDYMRKIISSSIKMDMETNGFTVGDIDIRIGESSYGIYIMMIDVNYNYRDYNEKDVSSVMHYSIPCTPFLDIMVEALENERNKKEGI